MPSFKRFTPESINMLDRAADMAIFCGHEMIGSEHLLLAYLENPSSIVEEALRTIGYIPEGVHNYAMSKVGIFALSPKDQNLDLPPQSPTLTRILAAAHSNTVGPVSPDHILLALLEDNGGHCAANNLLRLMCIEPSQLHNELVHNADLVD